MALLIEPSRILFYEYLGANADGPGPIRRRLKTRLVEAFSDAAPRDPSWPFGVRRRHAPNKKRTLGSGVLERASSIFGGDDDSNDPFAIKVDKQQVPTMDIDANPYPPSPDGMSSTPRMNVPGTRFDRLDESISVVHGACPTAVCTHVHTHVCTLARRHRYLLGCGR